MSKRDALKKLMAQNNTEAKPIDERDTPVDDLPIVKENTSPALDTTLDTISSSSSENESKSNEEQELGVITDIIASENESKSNEEHEIGVITDIIASEIDENISNNISDNINKESDIISSDISDMTKENIVDDRNIEERNAEKSADDDYLANKENTKKSTSDEINNTTLLKSDRILGDEINITSASTISWTCKIETETYLNFQLLVASQGTNKLELINRIIENEISYENDHPEFPEKEFVLNNLKNKSNAQGDDYISATFNITKENNLFLKKASQKCGMKMYVFLSYLINEYTGELI